jgi:hypothetical protein
MGDLIYRKGQKVGVTGSERLGVQLVWSFNFRNKELDENVLCNKKWKNSKGAQANMECHHWAGRGSGENCVSTFKPKRIFF